MEIKILVNAFFVLETPPEKVIFALIAHLAADPVHLQTPVLIVRMAGTVNLTQHFVPNVLQGAINVHFHLRETIQFVLLVKSVYTLLMMEKFVHRVLQDAVIVHFQTTNQFQL